MAASATAARRESRSAAGALTIKVGFKPEPKLPNKWATGNWPEVDFAPDTPMPLERTETRHLSQEQHKIISEHIAWYWRELPEWRTPVLLTKITIRCPEDNGEALAYATELCGVLKDSRCVVGVVVDSDFPRRLEGTAVRSDFQAGGDTWMDMILPDAFEKAGVEIVEERGFDRPVPVDPVEILVGW